ncbi:outer membrane protein TolC [Hephaestia caeni]|uniref:Outer membrane protein TolC n=1 Tax=Hephaestia caeni TaxID=645617 RepID=A0A397P4W0_9SPHN|nr:TolC family protein [Hephaestia caeni]RIA44272.1 outer membrane protein TolC [Hephaestia caeni]
MRASRLLLAAMLVPSMARAGPLTFQQALRLAQADAPSLRAKEHGIDAARAARGAAGALPDPTLGLSVDSFPISGPLAFEPNRDNFTWVKVGVSQDIPNLAKRHAQQARADTNIAAAQAEAVATARDVEVATALAWINLAYAERRVTALDDVLGRLQKIVRTSPQAVASGSARPAQVIAGEEAVAKMQDRRSELIAAVAQARASLTRWTGDPAPEISGPIPQFDVNAATLRAAIDQHPMVEVASASADQANADLRLAEADRRPDFGVNLAYQHRDPRFGDYVSAGVTIGLPIFTRHRQNAQIAASEAEAAAARAAQEDVRRALADKLASDIADHVMHHEQWLRARDTLQPLAERRVKLETASYAAGRASLADIADAHAALADAILTTLDREAVVAADGARLVLTYRSEDR